MYHCHKCNRLCQLHKGKYIPHKDCKCNKGKPMKCSAKRRPLSEPDKKGIKIDDWLSKHPLKRKSNRRSSSGSRRSSSGSRRSSSGGFEIKTKPIVARPVRIKSVKARRTSSGRGTKAVAVPVDRKTKPVHKKPVKARRTSSGRGTKAIAVPVHRKKKSMSIEERNFFWDQFAKKKKRKHTKKKKNQKGGVLSVEEIREKLKSFKSWIDMKALGGPKKYSVKEKDFVKIYEDIKYFRDTGNIVAMDKMKEVFDTDSRLVAFRNKKEFKELCEIPEDKMRDPVPVEVTMNKIEEIGRMLSSSKSPKKVKEKKTKGMTLVESLQKINEARALRGLTDEGEESGSEWDE